MKSKDLQNFVLLKYQAGGTSTKTFRDLNGGNGLRTIQPWCQIILQSGSITLSSPPGAHVWPERKEIFERVFPVALKYGNQVFGSDWVFQQDGAKPHSHHLTQQRCRGNFPSFIGKDRWPPNSPDLNPLDYSIWDKLANSINWNTVQSKTTLIQQINSSFKNIRESVVFEGCASFTNRLYRLCQNDGNYLG
ncbi:unnamed protein product [Rotaria magnacalcarata]|uniref:Uncharacterized protein n=1 Tax=Rotaria magnacalcarata TaxID=392030 RepID=A0A8S3E226_9BILA|nr:unnamed protein product [Rotaria magnacalcarata]CAF5153783.1 unnamed protein product [Rotaria magnacalcarata]CAF5173072.1 unnamed protein product [Rotaria magnacalcarata]